MTNLLTGLMTKTGGPKTSKRLLFRTTVISAILYAASVWGDAMKIKKYENMLESVNRRLAIMITSAYRTVSTDAILAIAGTIPISLSVFAGKEQSGEIREQLFRKWQSSWEQYNGWAKTFVRDLKAWSSRKWGHVDYHVMQAMTGHGVFGTYLLKIRKMENGFCLFCFEQDTPKHTCFECTRFSEIRVRAPNIN